MIPPKSIDAFTGFGWQFVLYENYLITSSIANDSLGYDSGIVYVYDYTADGWQRIAELTPSVPTSGMTFGLLIDANKNNIAVVGETYTPEGTGYQKVFVFTKTDAEKWSSRNESYIINPLSDPDPEDVGGVHIELSVSEERIVLVYYYGLYFEAHHEVRYNIYNLEPNIAILEESIEGIKNELDRYEGPVKVRLQSDFLIVSLQDYQFQNLNKSGRILVYNYDVDSGWDVRPSELTPSRDQVGFGTSLAVTNNEIFVLNNYSTEDEEPKTQIFIYERAGSQWVNQTEIATLTLQSGGYGSGNDRITANEDYVIHSLPKTGLIKVFKKGDSWRSKEDAGFNIRVSEKETGIGWKMDLNEDHFVYNLSDFSYTNQALNGSELNTVLLDESFESSEGVSDQILRQHSFGSSGDEFSNTIAFSKSVGVVGSVYDNDQGRNSGAVITYKRNDSTLKWDINSKIYSPDVQSGQVFGDVVAITEKYLFVSAPEFDSIDNKGVAVSYNMGKVYQFVNVDGSWVYKTSLVSPDVIVESSNEANQGDGYELVYEKEMPIQLKYGYFEHNETGIDDVSINRSLLRSNQIRPKNGNDENDLRIAKLSVRDFEEFGRSVVYHNGYLAIGQRTSGGSDFKGRIYIYKLLDNEKWNHVATLQASDDSHRDWIGYTKMYMNDTLVIAGSANSASVFIFKRGLSEEWSSGTESARLIPDRSDLEGRYPRETLDGFGVDLDMYEDMIVVGAPHGERERRFGPKSGRAYLFKMPKGGWNGNVQHQNILKPKERILDGVFGYSVAIDKKNIFVGSPHSYGRDANTTDYFNTEDELGGRAYIFDRSAIDDSDEIVHEVGQIVPEDGEPFDGFGFRIAKTSLEVIIGARLANTENGFRSGAAYMYKKVSAIEEGLAPICKGSSSIIDLVSYPVDGGVWSGEGIIDREKGLFDPSLLSEGVYEISYQYGECLTTSQIYVYEKPVISSYSEDKILCDENSSVELFVESNSEAHSYEWYYKPSPSESYKREYGLGDLSSISTNLNGYYYCIAVNGGCVSDPVYFEVDKQEFSGGLNQASSDNCTGEVIRLELTETHPMDNYTWYVDENNTGNYEIDSYTSSLEVTMDGKYFCEFISESCIHYSDTVSIFFKAEQSVMALKGPLTLCKNEGTDLTLESMSQEGARVSYQWYGDSEGFDKYELIAEQETFHAAQAGKYFCKSITKTGCIQFSDTIMVNILDVDLAFDPISPVCNSLEVVDLSVSVSGGVFYLDGFPEFFSPALSIQGIANGTYQIVYRIEEGGCVFETSQELVLDVLETDDMIVPNVFTPNGDGINDDFHIVGLKGTPDMFSLRVFDRDGKAVFQTANSDFHWTGLSSPSGVYFWSLETSSNCQNEKTSLKGYIHLLR